MILLIDTEFHIDMWWKLCINNKYVILLFDTGNPYLIYNGKLCINKFVIKEVQYYEFLND